MLLQVGGSAQRGHGACYCTERVHLRAQIPTPRHKGSAVLDMTTLAAWASGRGGRGRSFFSFLGALLKSPLHFEHFEAASKVQGAVSASGPGRACPPRPFHANCPSLPDLVSHGPFGAFISDAKHSQMGISRALDGVRGGGGGM